MIPLGFAAPWALAFGLAIPLLILAYLRRRQTKRYVVSSVLVLKTLPKRNMMSKMLVTPVMKKK